MTTATNVSMATVVWKDLSGLLRKMFGENEIAWFVVPERCLSFSDRFVSKKKCPIYRIY